jgi:hypothetical protein
MGFRFDNFQKLSNLKPEKTYFVKFGILNNIT